MASLKTIIFTPRPGTEMFAAVSRLKVDDVVTLVREPENPVDERAIACYHDGSRLGYLVANARVQAEKALSAGAVVTITVYEAPVFAQGKLKYPPKILLQWEPANV